VVGLEVPLGENAWGADTVLIAADAIDVPFKVLGYSIAPTTENTIIVGLSADSGASNFVEKASSSKKNKAVGGGDATDFIFNAGTRISASGYASEAGKTFKVWLEIQEI